LALAADDVEREMVCTYRKRLMEKLDLHTLADLVRYAVRSGMIV